MSHPVNDIIMEHKRETIEEIAEDIYTLCDVLKADLEAFKSIQTQFENDVHKQVELARKLKSLVD